MSRLGKLAKHAFTNYPFVTNSVVYGTLYVAAEFSQQTITRKIMQTGEPLAYDPHMITRYGVLGVVVYPPVYYYWYKWLDKKFVGTTYRIVTTKLLMDQFLVTPPLLAVFFVAMSIMENKPAFEECRKKFVSAYQTSCMFWIPAQTANFLLVAPTYRVAYVASCAFAWVNILCWIKRKEY